MADRHVGLTLAAVTVAVLAVSPPVDALTADRLAWHMAQHLVLLGIAAPLGVVATMPRRHSDDTALSVGTIMALAALHVVVVIGWHVPVLFDAAERWPALHAVEHLSFLAAAAALWWSAGLGRRPAPPVATLAVFVASLPGIALGAAMTLAPNTWYAAYPSLADQQVAGALMWSIGGAVTVVCGALSAARWLSALETT